MAQDTDRQSDAVSSVARKDGIIGTMGRPKKQIDPEVLKKLCAIHCSWDEISDIMQVDRRTLERRFAQAIQEGRSQGKMSLRRKRYEVAMNGNVPMLIWLSKQILGETDKMEHQGGDRPQVVVIDKLQDGVSVGETVIQKLPPR